MSLTRSPRRLANLKDGHGRTALFDSLIYSAGLFQNRESGDAIYVITDGGDSLNGLHEKDAERELLSKGIRLFSFLVSAAKPPLMTEEERQGYSDLQRLGEVTGGTMLNVEYDPYEKERRELEASLQRGYNKMKSLYDLEVELPVKLDKEQRWKLQIVDERAKRQKGYCNHVSNEARFLPLRIPPAR